MKKMINFQAWFFIFVFCLYVGSVFAQTIDLNEEAASAHSESEPSEEEVKSADADSQPIRDPFESGLDSSAMPISSVSAPVSMGAEPVLQGVAISGTQATAVISGRTYVQGDDARNGIQIVEVRKGEVDIKWGGQPKTLKMTKKKEPKKEIKKIMSSNEMSASQAPAMERPDLTGVPSFPDSGYNPLPMEESK